MLSACLFCMSKSDRPESKPVIRSSVQPFIFNISPAGTPRIPAITRSGSFKAKLSIKSTFSPGMILVNKPCTTSSMLLSISTMRLTLNQGATIALSRVCSGGSMFKSIRSTALSRSAGSWRLLSLEILPVFLRTTATSR